MDDLPGQMDVLKMLFAYRKQYGPITDDSVENLADYLSTEIRAWCVDREDEQP